jgi:hypothetical protein
MPLYTFLQNLLNVLVQIVNKMGLQKENEENKMLGSSVVAAQLVASRVMSSSIELVSNTNITPILKDTWAMRLQHQMELSDQLNVLAT